MRIRVIDYTDDEPTHDTWLNDVNELHEWSRQREDFGRYEFADHNRHIITGHVLQLIMTWKRNERK